MARRPLRICFLTYRGNPQCGGQGIYTRHLTGALAALGHEVEVWSGPPYPELHDGVMLHRVPSLDLWNEHALFRRPSFREIRDPIHRSEWLRTLTGQFPEPHTFSRRVVRDYARHGRRRGFDVVHDNQCLGEGLLQLRRNVPVVATIHHPITVDREIAMAAALTRSKRWGLRRWYSFLDKQIAVAPDLDGILTVSEAAAEGIERDFGIARHRMHIVPNGVDLDVFRPLPHIERQSNRLIATISATNAPLKGFTHLLDAMAVVRRERPDVTLTVIGREGDRASRRRIVDLGLENAVRITGRLTTDEMVSLYAESTIAIVPSLYEGFGLPAIEAMACRVPVVSTNAGALPEVVGRDGHAGVLVQAGCGDSLARPILELLADPGRRQVLADAGFTRATTLFTWKRAAELCVDAYREAIARRRPPGDGVLRAAC
jgi:glycosyltransferase involved in cell wall biosynthesis